MQGYLTCLAPARDMRMRQAVQCVCALRLVIVFGSFGFTLLEQEWSIWKALFFTLITVTTVGYGDEGLSERGEVFAAVLLLVGIATVTYCFRNVVSFVADYRFAWRRRMMKRIKALKDHFVVCGFGKIGQSVCQKLAEANVPFIVVDSDQARYEEALELQYLAVRGNAHCDQLLQSINTTKAKGLVCATSKDAENVFITISVKEMNPDIYIASRAGYSSDVGKIQRAGAVACDLPVQDGG